MMWIVDCANLGNVLGPEGRQGCWLHNTEDYGSLARSFNFFGHDAVSALHLRDVVTGLCNQLCIRAVPGKKPHSLGGQHLNVDHSTPRMYRYPRPPVSQDF